MTLSVTSEKETSVPWQDARRAELRERLHRIDDEIASLDLRARRSNPATPIKASTFLDALAKHREAETARQHYFSERNKLTNARNSILMELAAMITIGAAGVEQEVTR